MEAPLKGSENMSDSNSMKLSLLCVYILLIMFAVSPGPNGVVLPPGVGAWCFATSS